jgi:hypothetical protein
MARAKALAKAIAKAKAKAMAMATAKARAMSTAKAKARAIAMAKAIAKASCHIPKSQHQMAVGKSTRNGPFDQNTVVLNSSWRSKRELLLFLKKCESEGVLLSSEKKRVVYKE